MLGAAARGSVHGPRGYLLVLAIVLPVAGVLLSFVIGGRHAERIALALMPVGLGVAVAILAQCRSSGEALTYVLGGWDPPLGVRYVQTAYPQPCW